MTMLKPKLKLVPITDTKEKAMKSAGEMVDRQRKSELQMPQQMEIKRNRRGYQ